MRDLGHGGMTLRDFCELETARAAGLSEAEVVALRCYTGPFYVPWNTALRLSNVKPQLLASWATCVSVLYSAIFKLSRLSSSATVFRGINESERAIPDSFISKNSKTGFAGKAPSEKIILFSVSFRVLFVAFIRAYF